MLFNFSNKKLFIIKEIHKDIYQYKNEVDIICEFLNHKKMNCYAKSEEKLHSKTEIYFIFKGF